MSSNVLKTPVDNLISIVKSNKNCTVTLLKERLRVPLEILERWLIILEEYGIIKVHYKGFEGFVSLTENSAKKKTDTDIYHLRDIFIEKSQKKMITYEKMKKLWPIFVSEYEMIIKEEFFKKAKELGYDDFKIDKAWVRFREDLNTL